MSTERHTTEKTTIDHGGKLTLQGVVKAGLPEALQVVVDNAEKSKAGEEVRIRAFNANYLRQQNDIGESPKARLEFRQTMANFAKALGLDARMINMVSSDQWDPNKPIKSVKKESRKILSPLGKGTSEESFFEFEDFPAGENTIVRLVVVKKDHPYWISDGNGGSERVNLEKDEIVNRVILKTKKIKGGVYVVSNTELGDDSVLECFERLGCVKRLHTRNSLGKGPKGELIQIKEAPTHELIGYLLVRGEGDQAFTEFLGQVKMGEAKKAAGIEI